MKNKLGKNVVMTSRVYEQTSENKLFAKFIKDCLMVKFVNCNWGDSLEDGIEMNNAVINGAEDRIFAVYNIPKNLNIPAKAIWIITEWDKSVTTILFPSDY